MTAPTVDENHPLTPQFRAVAHKHGITQEAVSDFLAIYASEKIDQAQLEKNAFNGELAKLGATAQPRIDSLKTWFKALDVAPLEKTLWTAEAVQAFEKLMHRFSSQGGGDFSQAHREQGQPNGKIPGYETMTFEQRRQAQDNARRSAGK